jgi:hypothetical protein
MGSVSTAPWSAPARSGVVLAHEYDNDLCGACPFANYPAKRGLRVFAVDVRCFGRSACPRATPPAGWSTTSSSPSLSCANVG